MVKLLGFARVATVSLKHLNLVPNKFRRMSSLSLTSTKAGSMKETKMDHINSTFDGVEAEYPDKSIHWQVQTTADRVGFGCEYDDVYEAIFSLRILTRQDT